MNYIIPEAGKHGLFQYDHAIPGGTLYCLMERVAADPSTGITGGASCVSIFTGPGSPDLVDYIDTATLQVIEERASEEAEETEWDRRQGDKREVPRFLGELL